jgi:lysophospholipase L1-like esterase
MPAMNGSEVSFRKGRLIGCCIAAVLLVTALFASSAGAAKAPPTPTNYTALGDSLAFGYTQQKFEENYPAESPTAFEGGYTNVLAKKLASAEKKAGNKLSLLNLGCPGEVSDGLIGTNPELGGGQSANGKSDSEPCAYNNAFPLHFEIGPASQLEAAIGIVTTPASFGATKYVTLNIGSNDELAVVHACENPEYQTAHGYEHSIAGLRHCLAVEASEEGVYYEKGLFHHIIANMGDVVGVLRHIDYTGPVAILGFYNPQALILPGSDEIQKALNETIEGVIASEAFGPGVVYANPFPKFNPQKNAKVEGRAICKLTEECNEHDKKVNAEKASGHEVTAEEAAAYPEGDIHPTPAGYKALAKILFEALGKP